MISGEINGLLEAQQKLEQVAADLYGAPMLDAMRQSAMLVTNDAKVFAPVDTGRLRSSITPEVRSEGRSVLGVVGSNVHYAPYQETGTRPHWPPIGALETWARRHGTSAFLVARAIARRGTKGKRYLQRAFDKNADRIRQMIGKAVSEIVSK